MKHRFAFSGLEERGICSLAIVMADEQRLDGCYHYALHNDTKNSQQNQP